MRFSAPRSPSPSPVRSSRRYSRRSTFGLPPDSSDEETDSDESDGESTASSSTDSFCYKSDSEVPPPPPRPKRPGRTLAEQHLMEDTVASIRLHVQYRDPYEEWEKQVRKDAFRIAKEEQSVHKSQRHRSIDQAHSQDTQRLASLHQQQVEEVQAQLAALNMRRQREEEQLKRQWAERNRLMWQKVDASIKLEEDKVKARLEAERKKREEEDRRRKEEEERRRAEEERKRQEEERKRQEEEKKRAEERAQKEEEERILQEQQERENRDSEERDARNAVGFTTAGYDWQVAREILMNLKQGAWKQAKLDRNLKSVRNQARRAITPKIGQLTDDAESVNHISHQIVDIARSTIDSPIYPQVLAAIAKAILLQAETEVTAEKRSARPLGHVLAILLEQLQLFSQVFWAKFVQRAGGWPVPMAVPLKDFDGRAFADAERVKLRGRREDESVADFTARVAAYMRVYFHALCMPETQGAARDPPYRFARVWTYFSRMLDAPHILLNPVAPAIMYAALEVGGTEAARMWGQQWAKLMGLLYEGVTVGLGGSNERLIGGQTPEGIAARVRVQLEIERVMTAS
ncbi:hypothetical protein CERSUDRAFT_156135 [Gelatoporia subvermispora B]|uniref:mRNA export factor GLE1 n=1 Tax=Ceriporiopsis subvermispora (strain B) TaxID=914234 RepID=M2PJS8_CERS8|nr:hypothetical protein CERSUDRAFT_156135 [Gelatoporia subvermispora B]